MAASGSGGGTGALEPVRTGVGSATVDDEEGLPARRVATRREELLAQKRQELATLLVEHDAAVRVLNG